MRCLCYPVFVLLLAGCASYVGQTGAFRGAWNSGSIEQAAQLATRQANQRSESRDAVIWFLEQGAALRELAAVSPIDYKAVRKLVPDLKPVPGKFHIKDEFIWEQLH